MKHLILLFTAFFMFSSVMFAGSAPTASQTQVALENLAPTHQNPVAKEGKKMNVEKAEKKAEKLSRKLDGGKNRVVAILLCLFLGPLGIHRFYMGDTWQGVVQLLTGGGLVIWALIDLIRLIAGGFGDKF